MPWFQHRHVYSWLAPSVTQDRDTFILLYSKLNLRFGAVLLVVLLAPWSMTAAGGLVSVVLATLSRVSLFGAHLAIDTTGRTRMTKSMTVSPRMRVTHDEFTTLLSLVHRHGILHYIQNHSSPPTMWCARRDSNPSQIACYEPNDVVRILDRYMPTKDKALNSLYHARHYKKHAEQIKANVAVRRHQLELENREKLFKFLLEHPCVDCGETNPILLDFDHTNPANKSRDVSLMMTYSWKTIEKEIQKCKVRCAKCHRIKTAKQGNHWRYRMWCTWRSSNPQPSVS